MVMHPVCGAGDPRNDFLSQAMKPNEHPGEAQVLIKGEYVRGTKKYVSIHWNDINRWVMLKGDTIVYVGFTF